MLWIEARPRERESSARSAFVWLILLSFHLSTWAAGQQTPPPPLAPIAPSNPALPALPPPPPNPVSIQPAFSVVLDAAHGGDNSGARIGTQAEKDLTLGLSIRLRSALTARGIAVVTTRESDIDLPLDRRAGVANHARASACLVLHATATGSGVHLFTSSLPAATQPMLAPLPWQTAQSVWVTRSLRLLSEINAALGQAGIPATLGSTNLQPLDNLTCPAVAVEVAPLAASAANKAIALSDAKYQQRILDALSAAMLVWSTDWKQQP